jgi:hypothetical protein
MQLKHPLFGRGFFASRLRFGTYGKFAARRRLIGRSAYSHGPEAAADFSKAGKITTC